MATSTVPDVTASTHPSLLCLQPEERRKILLESLRAGYPCIPKVSRPVSAKVSRYVSQITSGRWRERIWASDESDDPEDGELHCETETEAPLIIYGYDLQCEDYAKEREMINRWNIVERELHFPNLEKGYVQKRDAKTQSEVVVLDSRQTSSTQDVKIAKEPTAKDVPMEECQESPQKLTEDIETSTEVSGQETSSRVKDSESQVKELPGDFEVKAVVEQESSCSVPDSKSLGLDSKAAGGIETSARKETEDKNLVSNLESSVPLVGKESEEKVATVPEDSKVVGSSVNDMKTSGKISPAEPSKDQTTVRNSKSSVLLEESEDMKEGLPKITQCSGTETSEVTPPESEGKVLVPDSESSTVLEKAESADKMEATTVLEDCKVASSEKAVETIETTSNTESSGLKDSVTISKSSVLEVKETAGVEATTVPEQSKVARTSETDMETSGTTLRGKRKADSSSVDDPNEKRTKKTSVEK